MVNSIPLWARPYLNPDRIRLINEAIGLAESKTSAEIVPMIVHRSSAVGHVPMLLALLLAFIFLLFHGPEYQAHWLGTHWSWYFLDVLSVIALSGILGRFALVQRRLTSRTDQEAQVDMRAELEFYESKIHKTQGATGILLFVSLMEHRAVVLADNAISEKLPKETWTEICQILVNGIKRQHIGIAFRDAVLRCGEIVSPIFPINPRDANELIDQLIVKE